MSDDVMTWVGDAVKTMGNGRIGGYLVRFSAPGDDATPPDVSHLRDYFTKSTDFGPARATPVWYQHCLDPSVKDRLLGRGIITTDDVGVWIEAQLHLRDEWERAIYQMAEAGKLSWSSGTSPHTVQRRFHPQYKAHEVTRWLLGHDASLTPNPASGVLPTLATVLKGAHRMTDHPIDDWLYAIDSKLDTLAATWSDGGASRKEAEELRALLALGGDAHRAGWATGASAASAHEIKALDTWLRDPIKWARSDDDALKATLQSSVDEGGGYTVQPQQFLLGLLKSLDKDLAIRTMATVYQSDSPHGLGQLTLENDADDPVWTAELAVGTESTALSLGKRELRPHPLARYILVSKTLVRQSRVDIVDIVQQRMQYKFLSVMENAYLTGDGQNKPLGLFTASANGIPTSRDITTAGAAISFDDLKKMKYKVRPGYWPKCRWLMHPAMAEHLDTLKDGNGRYLWQDAVTEDAAPRLLGRPVMFSEFAPESPSAGQYALLFGDFSYYWILDGLNFSITVSTERFILSNQNVYIGRYEGDGAPVLPEAFSRLKMKP